MRQRTSIIAAVIGLMISSGAIAQQKPSTSPDTMAIIVAKLSKTVLALEKIKISGYIQAQYQIADTLGVKSFNGGDFAAASSQRFMVRRGYFKVAYAGNLSTYVLQVNVNEKGFSVRDAYFNLKDPWLKAFSLTGGIFFRPFGYELSYSASQRESPESSRATQLLFPGERDLGASITFQMPEKSVFHPLKIEAGLFSGNGTSSETDDKLDFIGRIGFADATKNKEISYGLGASFYNGSVYLSKKINAFEMADFEGTPAFHKLITDTVAGNYYKRQYIGFDGQFAVKSFLGTTTIRGDYIFGKQPGSEKSSSSPSAVVDYELYLRKFSGAAIYLVHTIPNTIHSVVIKYDFFDPNTEISGDQIGQKHTNAIVTNAADITYRTWGFGYFADLNKNLRFTIYYELVKNETSSKLKNYGADQKDNVLTMRVQYKF